MTKKSFAIKENHAEEKLEFVQSDVFGPMNVTVHGGYEYFTTFIDDYSKFGYVYLMLALQEETFDEFQACQAEAEKQLDKSIKTLWYDRGGECLSNEFIGYL